MDENETSDSLSPEASAYFDSRGETTTPEPVNQPAEPPQEPAGDDTSAQQAIEGRQPTQVPLKALQDEREEKKALKARIEEFERKQAILEDRWNTILKLQQPQQEQQPVDDDPEPDPNQDIFAHNQWLARQNKRLLERIDGREQAEQQATQAQQQEARVWQFWEHSAREFAGTQADFSDAAKWLSEFRDNQLQALAVADQRFSDPGTRNRQIEEELKQIVVAAAQQGKSPAELVYGIAKGYGYKAAAPAVDPGAAIEKIAANADAEFSLSNMGGAPASKGPKSAEDVSNMSANEFEAWLEKNGDAGFKRLMGGR